MTDTSPRSATSRPAPTDPAPAPEVGLSSAARSAPDVPAIPQEALLEEPRRSRLPAAIRAMRPRQWVKNVLVFLAPLAAGKLFERDVLLGSALAFVAFCLMSATVYLVNDVRDVEEDRLHPRKRFRPIAAGELKPQVAVVLAIITGAAGLTVGFLTAPQLGVTLLIYLLVQLGYSAFLKHLPVVDLAMVASGFLLRAIAGGVASDIPLSQWFLLVAAFGSFFMVAGKRYSEIKSLGSEAGTRRSLERYSESYLRFAWMLAAVMVLISYSLWAFTNGGAGAYKVPWTAISIAPFTLGLLQYALEVDSGNAGEPEEVVLHDRVLQVIGLVWLVVISIGVFTG
ncbi:MAG: decaprenyl-phosphate phosphoribosyltransferase [Janthinobacterium lividum]